MKERMFGTAKVRTADDKAPAGTEDGYRIIAYLAAGLLFYGGIGWLLDRWLDTSFLLPVGIIVGVVLAMYSIIKRYGNPESKTEEEQ